MWYNPLVIGLLRSPVRWLVGSHFLLLTYRGRKTGKARTLPVNFARDGEHLIIISFRRRIWWRNLRGGGPVWVIIYGREQPAHAEVVEEPGSVALCLRAYISQWPAAARYLDVPLSGAEAVDDQALLDAAASRVAIRLRLITPVSRVPD